MRFDILHIADLRFPGGTSGALAHEIRTAAQAGYSVGVLQKRAATLKQSRPMHPAIRAEIDAGRATLVAGGEPAALSRHGVATARVEARLAVLHNPYSFETLDAGAPRIAAGRAVMVAHQPAADATGVPYYDLRKVCENASRVVEVADGGEILWAPISPASRLELAANASGLKLLDSDWTNIVFVDDWTRPTPRPRGARPVIGRHSRPDWAKWPASVETLFMAYPADPAYDVRLLGAGEALDTLLDGAPKPANWTTWAYNQIGVKEFLDQLDIFVYYHHPEWIEGFGRTIAEAMAAGIPVILPEHFRATFGPAAIYQPIEHAREAIDELWDDPDLTLAQGRHGRRWIARHYGPERYLARVGRLIGAPDTSRAGRAGSAPDRASAASPTVRASQPDSAQAPFRLDVLHVGDMRTLRDAGLRIAEEVRIEAAAGYRVGLLHLPGRESSGTDFVNPEIDLAARFSAAVVLDPATRDPVSTRLLLVHQPDVVLDRLINGEPQQTPRILAERVVAICDRGMTARDVLRRDALYGALWGPVLWTALDDETFGFLSTVDGLAVDERPWELSIRIEDWRPANRKGRELLIVGRLGSNDRDGWPATAEALADAYPDCAQVRCRMLGWPKIERLPTGDVPRHWDLFRVGETSVQRFLGNCDVVVHHGAPEHRAAPVTFLAKAMVAGRPVIGDASVRRRLGGASRAASPGETLQLLRTFFWQPELLADLARDQARAGRRLFGDHVHRSRLVRLIGAPATDGASRPAPATVGAGAGRRRVLFLTSNGVGLGHLTRLLAIARRMPSDVDPVFLTMSQGLPIVRQCGYPVEYLPFHVYAGCDPNHWNTWFARQLGQVIDFHRVDTVIFDAGNPYQGMLDAMAQRPDVRLVWVRRGMWREQQNNAAAIARQKFFDLIIEPTDIAESLDRGATAQFRALATRVDPIRFLDDDEVLSKDATCRALGLDPDRPRCLIQLGSGSNRDIVTMIDTVLEKVRAVPGMQPVLAEWMISPNPLDLWPGIKRLRGFPLSRYFSAFDFTISAAGYNSFNEIVSFGLPAVFMANDHATMDDQGGRARFAQDNDAAFHLPDNQPRAVGPLVEQLLDPGIRTIMAASCRRIALGNGAQAAADAVAAL